MIEVISSILSEYGLVAGSGVGVVWLGMWLRKAQRVAAWAKFAGMITILTGVGSLTGVVNLGRLIELIQMVAGLFGGL